MGKEIDIKNAKCTGLSLQAPVEFKKESDQKTADFVIEAYTGAVVDRWWGKLAIAIDGIKAKKQIPIFRDHQRGNIVGYSSDTWKDGSFYVSGKFSQATQHAVEVKALAAEGFPWQASIGVMPKKILSLEDGVEHEVNGKKLKGPAEIWLQSEVYETSFVPLGADDGTSVSVFSKFEEAAQPTNTGQPVERTKQMAKENEVPAALTIETLRADHPEMVTQLLAEGAESERLRIKAVLDQAMPGHEGLIQTLAFDGKTTGPEAAVQILAAEKKVRGTAVQNLAADAVAPVAHVVPPTVEVTLAEDVNAPIDQRAKARWDKDPEVRAEFRNSYERYLAYRQAEESGRFKVLSK